MNFKGLNVLVIGTGKSGIGATRLLLKIGANVILYDAKDTVDRVAIMKNFQEDAEVRLVLKDMPDDVWQSVDCAVISPGVPIDSPMVEDLKMHRIPVYGEVELAYQSSKGDLLAITGTNGKTTTTSLVGEIMKAFAETEEGRKVFVVGNIGNPYTDAATATDENSIVVAEISSFQLETIHEFHPHVSAILNITPDHLNRHHTMENYVAVKERIAEKQTADDTIVLNYDDSYTREFGERTNAKVVYFTRNADFEKDLPNVDFVHLQKDDIYYNGTKVINIHDMNLIGSHNYENVMAAVGMAFSYGVPVELIADVIRKFKAVEHRIEYVETINDVVYYNDSKGTNTDAAIKAIEAMSKPTLLIGGGYDKKLPYDDWIKSFGDKVKLLVLMGETAGDIKKCAEKHGFTDIVMVGDLKEAVQVCHDHAEKGDAVLLSPACASWDMFKSYEERGDLFKQYVREYLKA